MNKDKLLHTLANHGYNIGFGAKKNFASHDIVVKLPGRIGFIVLAVGILQLGYTNLGCNKELSTLLILISVASLYISSYNSSTEKYEQEGVRLTRIFNQIRDLYYSVESSTKSDFEDEIKQMNEIMSDFYSNSISKQVFLSDWFAHFKFFYQMQIDWIDQQLKFKFFRDKFPNSLKTTILFCIILILIIISYEYFGCI